MSKYLYIPLILIIMVFLDSCERKPDAREIIKNTINSIDTIETIVYRQDMVRSNPRSINDTISRYREMYFSRLVDDSIVGVVGHWYMYVHDKEKAVYEDIYDGKRLIRKNNRDSLVRKYDLEKYPGFGDKHFWSHNTLYGMQNEFRFILKNPDAFSIELIADTIIDNQPCFQIRIELRDQTTLPGFAMDLTKSSGSVSVTTYAIAKYNYYPLRIYCEFYSEENPQQRSFFDQKYSDIHYNQDIDDSQFNTSDSSVYGYEMIIMMPD